MKRRNVGSIVLGVLVGIYFSGCADRKGADTFVLSGDIEGLRQGDTLLITEVILPTWEEKRTDTIWVTEDGKFCTVVPLAHTTYFAVKSCPEIRSCMLAQDVVARPGDQIRLKGKLSQLGAWRHEGGLYVDSTVARFDSLEAAVHLEQIYIYAQAMKYQEADEMDSVAKYGAMYNRYEPESAYKEVRTRLEEIVPDNEFAAFLYARGMHGATYQTITDRYVRFIPSIRDSYFGQLIDRQREIVKNISEGFSPRDFVLTDSRGKEHALSDYKGKYVLIYHWGLCPGTFWVNPRLIQLYKKYHEKGFEVLGLTPNDLRKTDPQLIEEERNNPEITELLNHPWPTVYTSDLSNRFITDELFLAGVPILMLISPEGVTLVRGYAEVYEKLETKLKETFEWNVSD